MYVCMPPTVGSMERYGKTPVHTGALTCNDFNVAASCAHGGGTGTVDSALVLTQNI